MLQRESTVFQYLLSTSSVNMPSSLHFSDAKAARKFSLKSFALGRFLTFAQSMNA
jgi:hypothetical protein